jgi:hypothetical protein
VGVELSSNDRTIRRVLAETFFLVPRYQRPYSWNRDNVMDLWDDAIRDSSGDYFIGSMVVHPVSDDTVAVVDGQQRLTTLLMILCAVRDVADRLGLDKLGNGTHNLIERRDEEDQVRAVLHSKTAHPFLDDFVLNRGEPQLGDAQGEEQEAIRDAFLQVRGYIDAIADAVTLDPKVPESKRLEKIDHELRDVREKVLGLRVVFVETGSRDDATTVFVTLNSRGKDLEPSDLVKAQLLAQLPKKGSLDRPMERWQRIVDLFDASEARPDMTDFLLAMWRSRYGTATAKTLDKAVRKEIKKKNADRYLTELEEDSKLYRVLVEPGYRRWGQHTELRDSLQFLLDFGIRQPRPLLLSLLRAYGAKQIKAGQFKRALRAIENYHFTFNILAGRSSSGGMSAFYASRALKLTEAGDAQARASEIDDLVKELKSRRPTDDEFDAAFQALEFTEHATADKKKIQYILRRFHEHYQPRAPVDYTKMTIEHLASQSAGGDRVGELGNLVYVSETLNNKLDSKGFAAKKKILAGAKGEWVPDDVLAATSWGAKQIDQRTQAMAEQARTKVWR